MKLTKAEKIEAYTYALLCSLCAIDGRELNDMDYKINYDVYCGYYVCHNLSAWLIKHQCRKYYINPLPYFPEFESQKPRNKGTGTWWEVPYVMPNSHLVRIRAIERAIQLTEQLPD